MKWVLMFCWRIGLAAVQLQVILWIFVNLLSFQTRLYEIFIKIEKLPLNTWKCCQSIIGLLFRPQCVSPLVAVMGIFWESLVNTVATDVLAHCIARMDCNYLHHHSDKKWWELLICIYISSRKKSPRKKAPSKELIIHQCHFIEQVGIAKPSAVLLIKWVFTLARGVTI